MKKCLICFICLIFCFCLGSCCSAKPVTTTSHERIETNLQPIPIGADTIIIESVFSAGEPTVLSRRAKNATASSVSSVGSVREKENSVRIKSTRGVNISRYETDTTSTLRITLRPDTVFVPYTNHIRSDTIVVPDRICQQKLIRSNMTNLFLILILIVIIIILLKQKYKFYR